MSGHSTAGNLAARKRTDEKSAGQQAGTSGLDHGEAIAAELRARLHTRDLGQSTAAHPQAWIDQLPRDYARLDPQVLAARARPWGQVLDSALRQPSYLKGKPEVGKREIYAQMATVSLLMGCVRYDQNRPAAAEAHRRAALHASREIGDSHQQAWAFELWAWAALTRGNLRTVVRVAQAGRAVAPTSEAAVQLCAQEAKAWARMGQRTPMQRALERGQLILDARPQERDLASHFVVDPDKYTFHEMDCYSVLAAATGDEHVREMAQKLAVAVLDASTAADGTWRSPMRAAQAHLTLAVVAAQAGDLPTALELADQAFSIPRQSLPSLLTSAGDLAAVLGKHYPKSAQARQLLTHIEEMARPTSQPRTPPVGTTPAPASRPPSASSTSAAWATTHPGR